MPRVHTRKEIVREARSWLGTQFMHQGRVKRTTQHAGGCDCIGLIAGIARDLKLNSHMYQPNRQAFVPLAHFDTQDYPRVPDGTRLKRTLDGCCIPTNLDQLKPADILLFKLTKQPQHVAMVSAFRHGRFDIIHAYMHAGKVVEHPLDARWLTRIVSAYSLPHITD